MDRATKKTLRMGDKMSIAIETAVTGDGVIEQTEEWISYLLNECNTNYIKHILDTKEAGVRDALISLGWTQSGSSPFTIYDGTPETLPAAGTLCAICGWDYVGVYSPDGGLGPCWFNSKHGKFVPVEIGDKWIAMPVQK